MARTKKADIIDGIKGFLTELNFKNWGYAKPVESSEAEEDYINIELKVVDDDVVYVENYTDKKKLTDVNADELKNIYNILEGISKSFASKGSDSDPE